jgi:HEAT repeat protein
MLNTNQDRKSSVRKAAAAALAEVGAEAEEAVPALARLIGGKEEDVRKAATEALKKIERSAPER